MRIGAVAVRKDGVIVTARNSHVFMPMHAAHAERKVMRKAGYGATVYIARVCFDGSISMAKPCPACEALLRNKRVKKVFYTNWDGKIEELKLN